MWIGNPEDHVDEIKLALRECALCGAEPFFFGRHWTTQQEHDRWAVDWVVFCLCHRCFADPVAPKLLFEKFSFFLDFGGPIQ